jgi:histone-lysine N-methyltransferase SETMAR
MRKVMINIVWNPTGFHVIDVLPNRCKFNSSYYQNEILGPLSEWRSEQSGAASRRLKVHADNVHARRHTAVTVTSQKFMEENGMIKAPYPLYSPDLAQSDFYFFDYVKRRLRGRPMNFPRLLRRF